MDWTDRLNSALDYLEQSLDGEVSIERAAKLAYCSVFHFCRMFEVVCGTGPAEYIRRRRLSRAALQLTRSDIKVIDIALTCGYETPEAFSKAFKRTFGFTPSEARMPGVELKIWPPLRLAVVLQGEKSMNFRIINKPVITIAGPVLRTTSVNGENLSAIPQFWADNTLNGVVGDLVAQKGPLGLVGVCYDFASGDGSFSYMIGVETLPGAKLDVSVPVLQTTIPEANYAVFDSVGPMPSAIQEVWKRAFSEWFPASGYEHGGSPDFEVYPSYADSRGDPTSADFFAQVWIPIRHA